MNLNALFGSPQAHRLGWTLLHSLWEIAAVAGLLGIALGLLRRGSPRARYLAACAGMAAMLVATAATFLAVGPPTLTSPPPARPAPVALVEEPILPALPPGQPPTEISAQAPAALAPLAAIVRPWSQSCRQALEPYLPWLVGAWLAGVAALSLWRGGGWLAASRLRVVGTRPEGAGIQALTRRLAGRLGLKRPVRAVQSLLVQTPMVIGWLKPVILLPVAAVTGLTTEQLEAILAHELAHVRRLDYLANLLQSGVEIVLFYHPAVWWVSRRMRSERERCCDDLAVAACGNRIGYVEALAAVEEARPPAPIRARGAAVAAGGTGGKDLIDRVRRLLGLPNPGASATARSGAAALAIVATLVITIGLHFTARGNDAGQTTTPPATQPVTQQKDTDEQWIEGRAIDRLGRPVEGAMVSLLLADFHEVKTDSEGGFRYPLPSEYLEGGALKRRTYAFVSCPERKLAGVAEIDGLHDPVTVRLQPAITLRGRVLDPGGKAVLGARIGMTVHDPAPEKLSWAGGFQYEEPTFDADGKFQIRGLPAGCRYTLDTSAPGFGQASREVDTGAARDGVLEIPPTVLRAANSAVSGIVIGPDDRPVGGARVFVDLEASPGQPSRQAVADPQGWFKIDGVCSGRLTLAAGSEDRSMHGVTVAEGGEDDVRVYLVSSRACVLPSRDKPVTLVGRPLPDLSDVGLDASPTRGKPLLICFWNSAQTQSQQALCDLSARRPQLAAKGVTVLGVLAFARNQQHLRYWLDKQAVDMPMGVVRHESLTDYVGMVRCLDRWGVRSLPWLIIANEAGIVQAEGFQMDDLEQAVELVRVARPRNESGTQPATQPATPPAPGQAGSAQTQPAGEQGAVRTVEFRGKVLGADGQPGGYPAPVPRT